MRFGYAIAYVDDVLATLDFYERAFGLRRGYVADNQNYGELDTGATRIAFVSDAQARTLIAGGYRRNDREADPPGFEFALVTEDVDGAYRRALQAGATSAAAPEDKPWGQRIAYVRDLNGVLVELVTPSPG